MSKLMTTLIENGAVSVDTVVTARTSLRNPWGGSKTGSRDFSITAITRQDQHYHLNLRAVEGSDAMAATCDDIIAIDGMSIVRFADVYNINADGSGKTIGKKRGRKPKLRII